MLAFDRKVKWLSRVAAHNQEVELPAELEELVMLLQYNGLNIYKSLYYIWLKTVLKQEMLIT